ncbi:MAG TPA: hypothetical protein VFR37_21530 [Longimicrobium sp.]|nr:hypothetical protein [Longimicrobium sp.]
MKKLKLKVEELRIEQFEVESATAATRGTVRGLESDDYTVWCGSLGPSDPCLYCVDMPITWSCEGGC